MFTLGVRGWLGLGTGRVRLLTVIFSRNLSDRNLLQVGLTENKKHLYKKIIVEGYRAVGSLNDSFQSSNFLLLLLFFIDFGQW